MASRLFYAIYVLFCTKISVILAIMSYREQYYAWISDT